MSLELQYEDFIVVTGDLDLVDVSNKTAMESKGWVFHGKEGCGTGNWYKDKEDEYPCKGSASWYCSGSDIGSISVKFKGPGLATLDFGNCYKRGAVVVRFNGATKGEAEANVLSKSITFEFNKGDELKISEEGSGMIKLNSFKVQGEKLNVYCIILPRRIIINSHVL